MGHIRKAKFVLRIYLESVSADDSTAMRPFELTCVAYNAAAAAFIVVVDTIERVSYAYIRENRLRH